MAAIVSDDRSLQRDHVGYFCPISPMASEAGLQALAPVPSAMTRAKLQEAGYHGQKTVLLGASDFPSINAESQIAASVLKDVGMEVDYVAMDWGTVTQRRTNKGTVDKGGWSAFFTAAAGLEMFDPTGHNQIRGNGPSAWFGWPESPRLEQLRNDWFAASDLAQQKQLCAEMQRQALQDVPYIPLGMFLQATSYAATLRGVLKGGFAMFHNVSRA